jgi:hypothetical protein
VEEGKERNGRPRRLEESGSGGGQRGRGGRCLAALPSHELLWGGRRWSTRGDEVGEKGRERIKSG